VPIILKHNKINYFDCPRVKNFFAHLNLQSTLNIFWFPCVCPSLLYTRIFTFYKFNFWRRSLHWSLVRIVFQIKSRANRKLNSVLLKPCKFRPYQILHINIFIVSDACVSHSSELYVEIRYYNKYKQIWKHSQIVMQINFLCY